VPVTVVCAKINLGWKGLRKIVYEEMISGKFLSVEIIAAGNFITWITF